MNVFKVVAIAFTYLAVVSADSFPRVRIFNPTSGVIWMTGQTRNIFWRLAYVPPPPIPPTLNITLRRWSDPAFALAITRNYPTMNLTFPWKIPHTLGNGDDYYLRIIPNRFYPNKPNIKASKSKNFTIINTKPVLSNKIHIVQPLGVSKWSSGQTRAIQWHVKSEKKVSQVSIFISESKGFVGSPFPYEIVSKLAAPTNAVVSYKWQVPFSFRSSDKYQVRIVVEVEDSEPLTVISKEFTIVQAGDAGTKPPIVVKPPPSAEN